MSDTTLNVYSWVSYLQKNLINPYSVVFFLRNRHVNQIHFSAETSNDITKIRI